MEITRRHWRGPNNIPVSFDLVALTDLHFRPHGDGQMKPRGHISLVLTVIALAAAILALACINVSGLILAETSERGADMAVHKALGARRIDMVLAVIRETLWINLISMGLALASTERLLPWLNPLLDLDMSMWTTPVSLMAAVVLVTVIAGALGGLYPALVVSRPQQRTTAASVRGGSDRWRGWLVAQLTLVIVLLIATHTMVRQWHYATREAPNFDGEAVVMIRFSDSDIANQRFVKDVRRIRGVLSAAESYGAPTIDFVRPGLAIGRLGRVPLTRNSIHPEFLKVYNIPIIAGRNLRGTYLSPETPREILVNASAVAALGYASAQAAIGQTLSYDTDQTRMQSKIVGVVPDLRFTTVYDSEQPMIFDNFSKYFTQISVKMTPGSEGATLQAIDAVWDIDSEGAVPIDRRMYREYLYQQYHDLNQQIRVFCLVAAVGSVLSILGLTGLSVFVNRHQVREMAIRRALGATFGDIFVHRLSPFVLPLMLANLLAIPIAGVALSIWLNAFASNVTLAIISFLGASMVTIVFAFVTLAAHSLITMRDVPIRVLRHQ